MDPVVMIHLARIRQQELLEGTNPGAELVLSLLVLVSTLFVGFSRRIMQAAHTLLEPQPTIIAELEECDTSPLC